MQFYCTCFCIFNTSKNQSNKLPQNKNSRKRITILDECFANPSGKFTLEKLEDLIKERLGVGVSKRTLQNDINYIREVIEQNHSESIDFSKEPVFIPKLFEGKKNIFKYSNPNLALGNQLLSKSDKEQLEDTLSILARYRKRKDFYWLDELFPRIEASFDLVHQDYDGLISYQSNRDYVGQSWVGRLYNQLLRKKVLIIEYKDFKNENSYLRKVHPYHLKQFNNRWFLFGHEKSEKYTGVTNLALDRIIDITETTEDIIPNTINWGDFFDEMIGVSGSIDQQVEEIKLKFSEKRLPYVLTKPIHGASQRMDKMDPDGLTVIIEVPINFELIQTILSFGNDVQVISPKKLVNTFKEIVNDLKELYEK